MVSAKPGEPEPVEEEEEEDDDEEDEEEPAKGSPKGDKKSPDNNNAKPEKKKKHAEKTAPELSEVVHLPSTGFKGFDKLDKVKEWEITSFSEAKVNKLLKTTPGQFVDFNSRQLSRIYPKGTRFDSSNYDPVPSWNCGAQVVAL